jgi:L-lactate dehydrogenase complex protein LldG
MSTARDDILARVRSNTPLPRPLPDWPAFAQGGAAGTFDAFASALQRMGGKLAEPLRDGDLAAWIASRFPDAAVVCSAVPEIAGNRAVDAVRQAGELDDVDVGVVRAAFGVAETGSVLLTEREMPAQALGFLAQHLVVLLDPQAIVATMHDAYRRLATDPQIAAARYAIFMTGPSATADIEGVLIHGAQGVRSLTVVALGA